MPRSLLRPLIVVLAAAPALLVAWGLFRYGVDIPFYDEWHEARLVARTQSGTITWDDLWAPYNSHRLLFARLLWLPVSRFTGWNVLAECWLSWLVGLAALAVLLDWIRRSECALVSVRGAALAFFFSLSCFSFNQVTRWLSGFHLQIPLSVLAALLGFTALLGMRFTWRRFGAAAACGFMSSFSFSAGLCFWPAALIPLLSQKYRSRGERGTAAAAWLLLAAAAGFLHQWNPGHAGVSSGSFFLKNAAQILPCVCLYIGSGFYSHSALWPLIGIAGIGYFLAECVLAFRDRRVPRVRTAYLALGWFVIFSAALTAAARGALGYENFVAVRYSPVRNMFWAALFALLANRLPRDGRRGATVAVWLVLFVSPALALVKDDLAGWIAYKGYCHDLALARKRILEGDRSNEVLGYLYPDHPDIPRAIIPKIQERRLSLFRNA